jgi:hypothetical protein
MKQLLIALVGSLLLVSSAQAAFPRRLPVAAPATQPTPVSPIPEPAALALFVLGVGVVGLAVRRRKV